MRTVRVFLDKPLSSGEDHELPAETSHHLKTVLRLKAGHPLQIFNGRGGYHKAVITVMDKKQVLVHLGQHFDNDSESPLAITLIQGISRGQRMDYTFQKAVELGVARIFPVLCRYGNVRLEQDKMEKRRIHWQKIVINACEQCGRNFVPPVGLPMTLSEFLQVENKELKLMLHPGNGLSLQALKPPSLGLSLLAGPEGGFSEEEVMLAREAGYHAVSLGPRILRTETAAVAALTACQVLWGDLR